MTDIDRMQQELVRYFTGEKNESLLFMAVGLVCIGASVWLFTTASEYRGMIAPLTLIALIQLAVGGGVYFRTDAQIATLTTQLRTDAAALRDQELTRMAKVAANFKIYKTIEIALLAIGIAMTYAFRERHGLYAAGVGSIIQSSIMLTLDLFAERRADAYIEHLRVLLG